MFKTPMGLQFQDDGDSIKPAALDARMLQGKSRTLKI